MSDLRVFEAICGALLLLVLLLPIVARWLLEQGEPRDEDF